MNGEKKFKRYLSAAAGVNARIAKERPWRVKIHVTPDMEIAGREHARKPGATFAGIFEAMLAAAPFNQRSL